MVRRSIFGAKYRKYLKEAIQLLALISFFSYCLILVFEIVNNDFIINHLYANIVLVIAIVSCFIFLITANEYNQNDNKGKRTRKRTLIFPAIIGLTAIVVVLIYFRDLGIATFFLVLYIVSVLIIITFSQNRGENSGIGIRGK